VARRLLVLGGTAEAAELARAAAGELPPGTDVITSLAGRTAPAPPLPGRVRVGGFGGADGLADFLATERIDLLIDATHPFAAAISAHGALACARTGVPRLMLLRPPWTPVQGDRWCDVASFTEAACLLPTLGRRVFLATGTGGIEAFAPLADLWFLVRTISPPPAPLPLARHTLLVARPPFRRADEAALLDAHRIEVLVSKNSGGTADAKLAAARDRGLPVVMIRRPSPPPGERVESVPQAIAWLRARL